MSGTYLRIILVLALSQGCFCGILDLALKPDGHFRVSIGGSVWLSGVPPFLHHSGKDFSVHNGSLELFKNSTSSGRDIHGNWHSENFHYKANNARFITKFRVYDDLPMIIFEQHFPDTLNGTSRGNPEYVSSGFPRFVIGGQDPNVELGYLNYGGMMVGDTTKWMDRWNKFTLNLRDGIPGGPIALFDRSGMAVVISSFSEFMSTSFQHEGIFGGLLSYGIMGSVTQIPKGHRCKIIMYYSPDGINQAFAKWGGTLRRQYGRNDTLTRNDLINNYLGYWMDNGSYYYYNTEKGMNYEDTIYAIQEYSRKIGIPYRYIQYDSWWYFEGPLKGVTRWEGRPEIFPHGMSAVHNRTGWPVVAHNRWWSSITPYAKQNGGKFNFVVEVLKSVPDEEEFWMWLFSQSKKWGLHTYEQDWMNVELLGLEIFKTNINQGKKWLMDMGNAATKSGLTLQYCMSNPRHALQALEINAVTQARVSDDYSPGRGNWKIGITSIFAHALRLAPYKDSFWSTSVQPGNPYGQVEYWPALNAVASTLSTGPVGPGDAIGKANATLINRCCNSEGLILKPNEPALAIDAQIMQMAFGGNVGPKGEVWTTYSQISSFGFGIILAADMPSGYSHQFYPKDFGFTDPMYGDMMVNCFDKPVKAFVLSDSHPLVLTNCTNDDFCLCYTSPKIRSWIPSDDIILLGEMDKWVPMSSKRFTAISVTDDDIVIDVIGGSHEKVTFYFLTAGAIDNIFCYLSERGTIRMRLRTRQCLAGSS